MSIFTLPDLGEGLQEAEIVTWHVSAGDHVIADQPLVSAIVTLDGNSVTPNGSTSTEAFEGSTVSFSLTTQ